MCRERSLRKVCLVLEDGVRGSCIFLSWTTGLAASTSSLTDRWACDTKGRIAVPCGDGAALMRGMGVSRRVVAC